MNQDNPIVRALLGRARDKHADYHRAIQNHKRLEAQLERRGPWPADSGEEDRLALEVGEADRRCWALSWTQQEAADCLAVALSAQDGHRRNRDHYGELADELIGQGDWQRATGIKPGV